MRATTGAERLGRAARRCLFRTRPSRPRALEPCFTSSPTWETAGSSGLGSIDGGQLAERVALPLDAVGLGEGLVADRPFSASSRRRWAISSVNPPLSRPSSPNFCSPGRSRESTWFLAAAEVPVAKDVEGAETGGADRALGVFAATRLMPPGRPGLVVSCGTAITVERVTAEGVWQGGAIAPGLGTMASALHLRTAQVPLIDTRQFDPDAPAASLGPRHDLVADGGIFWGTVGVVRELLARQAEDLDGDPWVIWAGGDAALLARFVSGRRRHDRARSRPGRACRMLRSPAS